MFTSPPFWRTAGGAGDPWWSYVVAMLHFDGSYYDDSPLHGSYAGAGGAVINTTAPLYGSGALDCAASDDARCSGGSFYVGTNDFCIELFFRDNNVSGANQLFYLLSGLAGRNVRLLSPSFGNSIAVDEHGGGHSGSNTYTFSAWHHSAVVRIGSNWTHYLDGTAIKTWSNSTTDFGTMTCWIGRGSSPNSGKKALIDDFRVTVGVPRYTTSFTPSGPFPNF